PSTSFPRTTLTCSALRWLKSRPPGSVGSGGSPTSPAPELHSAANRTRDRSIRQSANKTCVNAGGSDGKHRRRLAPDPSGHVGPSRGRTKPDHRLLRDVPYHRAPASGRSFEDSFDVAHENHSFRSQRRNEGERDGVRAQNRGTPRLVGDHVAERDRERPSLERRAHR